MAKCKDVDHPTVFHFACMSDNSHLVKAFPRRGAPVNIPVNKRTNLFVELLLEYGADLTWTNGYKMTALHLAMYNEKNGWPNDVTNFLYSKVENKEAHLKDKNGLSYFHIAVSRNNLDLVKRMLDAKQVDVNSKFTDNDRGFSLYTPLHFAVLYKHQEMVKLLVKHDADVNVASSQGTPLEMAFQKGLHELDNMFDLLLDMGANKADVTTGTKTLIHKTIYQAINEEHEDRDPTNVHGFSSTYLLDYIERLAQVGCDINAKDEKGNTALHIASIHISNSCVRRLLENGADVNVENDDGRCVLILNSHVILMRLVIRR